MAGEQPGRHHLHSVVLTNLWVGGPFWSSNAFAPSPWQYFQPPVGTNISGSGITAFGDNNLVFVKHTSECGLCKRRPRCQLQPRGGLRWKHWLRDRHGQFFIQCQLRPFLRWLGGQGELSRCWSTAWIMALTREFQPMAIITRMRWSFHPSPRGKLSCCSMAAPTMRWKAFMSRPPILMRPMARRNCCVSSSWATPIRRIQYPIMRMPREIPVWGWAMARFWVNCCHPWMYGR